MPIIPLTLIFSGLISNLLLIVLLLGDLTAPGGMPLAVTAMLALGGGGLLLGGLMMLESRRSDAADQASSYRLSMPRNTISGRASR